MASIKGLQDLAVDARVAMTNYITYIESLDEDKVSEEELKIYTQMQKTLKKHKYEYDEALKTK